MTFILDTKTPVTLVGGGPLSAELLARAVALAPTVVAADGGVHRAQDLGQRVDHVIGDMDSIDLAHVEGPQLHLISEQMSTDLDKCLYSINAPYFLGVGFLGARLDHQLAACHSLLRAAEENIMLFGDEDICFLAPLKLTLNLPKGTRFSLFPMGKVSGTSEGLKWPIHAYEFAPARMIGTSNETNAAQIELSFDRRRMLVILPIEFAESVIDQVFIGR